MNATQPDNVGPAFGVVLLGAGASSRMGRPKLLLPWADTTIVGHLIRQWQALHASQIAIVVRPDDHELHAELDRLDFPLRDRIENPNPERGMFSSILCAASWAGWKPSLTAWAIVLGDQPHLRLETLRALVDLHREHPEAICQPAYGGRARHPVFLPRRVFLSLRDSRAETFKDFLQQTSCSRVERTMNDSGLVLDLDRPEDYGRAVSLNFNLSVT
jgi:molybdenum cofactor cytidylyltransferase